MLFYHIKAVHMKTSDPTDKDTEAQKGEEPLQINHIDGSCINWQTPKISASQTLMQLAFCLINSPSILSNQ